MSIIGKLFATKCAECKQRIEGEKFRANSTEWFCRSCNEKRQAEVVQTLPSLDPADTAASHEGVSQTPAQLERCFPGKEWEPVTLISANFVLVHQDKGQTQDELIQDFVAVAEEHPGRLLDGLLPGFANLVSYETNIDCAKNSAEAYKVAIDALKSQKKSAVIFPVTFDIGGREFKSIVYLISTTPAGKKAVCVVLGMTEELKWAEPEETLRQIRNNVRMA